MGQQCRKGPRFFQPLVIQICQEAEREREITRGGRVPMPEPVTGKGG